MTDQQRDVYEILGGRVVLYHRDEVSNGSWHALVKFPKTTPIRRSLKTTDFNDAKRLAEDLFNDLRYRLERGMSLRSTTFSVVLDGLLSDMARNVDNETNSAKKATKRRKLQNYVKLAKYVREYFGDKDIDKITTADIRAYKGWRYRYWTDGPGSHVEFIEYVRDGRRVRRRRGKVRSPSISTLASEDVLLRSIFDHAVGLSLISRAGVPDIKTERGKPGRRPGFTKAQFEHLMKVSFRRLHDVIGNNHLHHHRFMLHMFVGIMGATGMRPFEATKLTWQDIFWVNDGVRATYLKLAVSGKGKERELVANKEAIPFINELLDFQKNRTCADDGEMLYSPSGYLFVNPDRSPTMSFKRGFRALLADADLTSERVGGILARRDPYSLRHYYATERLLAGVTPFMLAYNMGTSLAMIQQHYSHITPELAVDEITK